MQLLYIILFATFISTSFAQDKSKDVLSCDEIFITTDHLDSLHLFRFEKQIDFAEKEMNWEKLKKQMTFNGNSNIEINGFIRFVVRKDSTIDCIKISRGGITPIIDEKAISILKTIKFTPAFQNGKPVSTDMKVIYKYEK